MSSTNSGRGTGLKAIALRTISEMECRAFIAQLTDYPIDCDKQLDDERIAEIAAIRLLDDALDWYSDLDAETQESWKKLRKAILKEAKLRSGGASLGNSLAALPQAAVIPSPAAAPEGATSTDLATRVGRIHVEANDPLYSGYLSNDLSPDGCIPVTKEAYNALIVHYNLNDNFPIFHIMNTGRANTALGIQWAWDPMRSAISYHYGRLVIVDQTPPNTSSWTTAQGPCETTAILVLRRSFIFISDVSARRCFDGRLLGTYLRKDIRQVEFSVSYPNELDKHTSLWMYPENLCKVKIRIESL